MAHDTTGKDLDNYSLWLSERDPASLPQTCNLSNKGDTVMTPRNTIPTIYGKSCPHCGSRELRVKKVKGGYNAWHDQVELWAGNTEAVRGLHTAAYVRSLNSITYKCQSCRRSFASLPVKAAESELLAEPCTITFERVPKFKGIFNAQYPYINGIGIEPIHRKGSITIKSPLKHNTVFVTDNNLRGFKGIWSFEALPGESVQVSYKRPRFKGTKGGLQAPRDYSAYDEDAAALAQAQAMADETQETRKKPLINRILFVVLIIFIVLSTLVSAVRYSQWKNSRPNWKSEYAQLQQRQQLQQQQHQQQLQQLQQQREEASILLDNISKPLTLQGDGTED